MAVEIGTAYVSIVPSARGFGAALDKELTPGAAAAGDRAGAAAAGAFGRRLTLGIAVATTAATAGLVALGKKASTMGLKTAAANEQAAISFEKFTGSAAAGLQMITDLQRFAADTPFEFPALQETARMLLVAGIRGDKVLPMMRNIGDAVSASGKGAEGMQRASIAIQQMAASGRIYAEDLNQLRDAGVPVFELLTAATGESTEAIAEMVKKGELGGEALDQVFEALATGKGLERFTGLMERQSQTLLGLWSTLKDNIGLGLAEAMQPAVGTIRDLMPAINAEMKAGVTTVGPVLTRGVTVLIETVAAIMPTVAPILADVGGLLVTVLEQLARFVRELAPTFEELTHLLVSGLGEVLIELLPDFLALVKAVSPLAIAGARLASVFASVLAPALSAIMRAAEPLVAVLAAGMLAVFGRLGEIDGAAIFGAISGAMVKLLDAAAPLVDIFVIFVGQFTGAMLAQLPGLVTGFTDLAIALLPLVSSIAALARDVGPILLQMLVDYLPLLLRTAAVLVPLWVAWEEMRALWLDLWLRVLAPFVPLLAHLAEVVLPILERVLVPIVTAFADFVAKLGDTSAGTAVLAGLISGLIALKLLGWLLGAILPAKSLLSIIQLITFGIAFKNAWQGGEALANTGTTAEIAVKGLKKLVGALAEATVSQWLLVAAGVAWNIVTSPWFLIPAVILLIALGFIVLYQKVDWFRELVDGLWDSFQRGLDFVKELIGALFSGDFTKAGEMVSNMGGAIVDSLANVGNLIKDKVVGWATSIGEGLASLGGAVASWFTDSLLPLIGGWLSGLGNVFLTLFTKVAPYLIVGAVRMYLALLVWWYTTAIPWLVRAAWNALVAFVGWIKEAVPAALEALRGWLAAVGPWITDVAWPWIAERAAALKDAFTAWIAEAVPAALEALGGWLSTIGAWITGTALPAIGETAKGLGGAILGWLVDVVPDLVIGLGKLIIAFEVWYWTVAVPWLLRAGVALGAALLSFLQELPDRLIAGLRFLGDNIGGWIATAAGWIAEKASALAGALWGWIAEAIPPLLGQLGEWIGALVDWILGTGLPWLGSKIGELAGALWGWIAEAAPGALSALGSFLASIGGWIFETAIPFLIKKGLELLATFLLWMLKLSIEIPVYLGKMVVAFAMWLPGFMIWLREKSGELLSAFIGWLTRLPFAIGEWLQEGKSKLGEWFVALVPWLIEKGLALAEAIDQWLKDAVKAVPGLLLGFFVNLWNWITTLLPWLYEKQKELEAAILDWIVNAVKAAPAKLGEFVTAVMDFFADLKKKSEEATKGMFVGLANAFIAAVNWIIRTWNGLELTIPEIEILGQKIGGFTIKTENYPEFPNWEGFAAGGRPPRNRPSIVGEAGPEVFWPSTAGTIVPNDALSAGGGAGLSIGKVEVSGQDTPAETAFALRSELAWLSMMAGGT